MRNYEPFLAPLWSKPGRGAVLGAISLLFGGAQEFTATAKDQVEAAMRTLRPELTYARYDKGNASAIADDTMLESIADECQAVVAAYGH